MVWILIGVILLGGVILCRVVSYMIRSPAIDVLRLDEEYLEASSVRKREMENERLASYRAATSIGGYLVEPGEEIQFLWASVTSEVCCREEAEEEWQERLEQLPEYLELAKKYMARLRAMNPENAEHAESLRWEIEDGNMAIEEAEMIAANPEETLAKWRKE